MAKASFTPVGNCADSPEPLLELSPTMGRDPEIRQATIYNCVMMQRISSRGGARGVTAVHRQVCRPRHADPARCRAERTCIPMAQEMMHEAEISLLRVDRRRHDGSASAGG